MSNQMIFLRVWVCVFRCFIFIVVAIAIAVVTVVFNPHLSLILFVWLFKTDFFCDLNWVRNLQFAIIHVCCLHMNKHTEIAQYTNTSKHKHRARGNKKLYQNRNWKTIHNKTAQNFDSIRFDSVFFSLQKNCIAFGKVFDTTHSDCKLHALDFCINEICLQQLLLQLQATAATTQIVVAIYLKKKINMSTERKKKAKRFFVHS